MWQLVLEQFDDLLVKILLLAAVVSFVSAHCLDFMNEFVMLFVLEFKFFMQSWL